MKNKTFNRKRYQALVDALRRSFLYQTPQAIFASPDDEEPVQVVLRMPTKLYKAMMRTIHEAGGWTLPPTDKKRLLEQHELQARRAVGDGVTYDFSDMKHGDLIYMHAETAGISELEKFHAAIGEELKRRGEESRGEVSHADA